MLEERCLHGMEKQTCGFCNSVVRSHKSKIKPKLEVLYNERRKQLNNSRDLWQVEEFILLYSSFNGVLDIKRGKGKTKLLQTCLTLGRTKMAVIWQYKHMFVTKNWERCKNMFEAMELLTV